MRSHRNPLAPLGPFQCRNRATKKDSLFVYLSAGLHRHLDLRSTRRPGESLTRSWAKTKGPERLVSLLASRPTPE